VLFVIQDLPVPVVGCYHVVHSRIVIPGLLICCCCVVLLPFTLLDTLLRLEQHSTCCVTYHIYVVTLLLPVLYVCCCC